MTTSLMMHDVYIALGSNQNNPKEQLDSALRSIALIPHTQLIKQSRYFDSTPMGFHDQDDFVNAACHIQTTLSPDALLDHLQAIEQSQGRCRTVKNGPRTIDCDIVLFPGVEMNTERLILPHPGLEQRDFVLIPLRDINPDLLLPSGKTVSEQISTLSESYVRIFLTASNQPE